MGYLFDKAVWLFFGALVLVDASFPGAVPDDGDYRHLYPLLTIGIYLENDSHILPYFFGLIENLYYPKDRMLIRLYLGQCLDATRERAKWWVSKIDSTYRSLNIVEDWDNWREDCLVNARAVSKYLLILRASHLLTNNRFLQHLIRQKSIVISPLLDGHFHLEPSVYISEDFNSRHTLASLKVDTVAEPIFIDLSNADAAYLTFSHNNLPFFPSDQSLSPLSVFALSAQRMNIPFVVNNELFYGYSLLSNESLESRRKLVRYFIADLISDYGLQPIDHSKVLLPLYPKNVFLGVDKVYLINLERRPERRRKMERIFKILGINHTLWKAVDGYSLKLDALPDYLALNPDYEDPYHKRPMKAGEIGCFLSHYYIWKEIVEKSIKRAIVFEDDLRFTLNSIDLLLEVIKDLDKSNLPWDFIYLGRKKLQTSTEEWVKDHRHLSTVGYSYWTLGYMITLNGAKKLVKGEPLKKLLPVDEYIPIMFDDHPNVTWKKAFSHRNLIAYTMFPLVVVPQRYTNEEGYISDTEDSEIVVKPSNSIRDEF